MSYLATLINRWGLSIPRQLLRMYLLHRVEFLRLLRGLFDVLDQYDSRFTFPTVSSIASMRPDIVRLILPRGHEIASHGHVHLRYSHLSPQQRQRDLLTSIAVLRRMGIEVRGFRAPYDNYTDDMPALIDRAGLLWDAGFGYRPEYRGMGHFFKVRAGDRELTTTFIPLNIWSDDLMVDRLHMTTEQMSRRLRTEAKSAARAGGVLMLDLHPIRIGQPAYRPCLEELLDQSRQLDGWCPTVTQAVEYWKRHHEWPDGHRFCLLLTGDIDNWTFGDYLRREIWRREYYS
ncbi:MAG: polysaccharide deacetylase family protein [Candidatus Thorarchaeota archaeon]